MKKYIKKPVIIEAIQWTGNNEEEIDLFLSGDINEDNYCLNPFTNRLYIFTLEGKMEARVYDYIIKGVKGEFYPCNPVIFELTYEEVK